MKKAFKTLRAVCLSYSSLRNRLFSQRWLRYGTVGAAASATYMGLGILFVNILSLPLLIGNALAYILSFAVSYAGQSLWTFQSDAPHSSMLPKFAATQAGGLALNAFLVGVCVKYGIPYFISMLIAIAAVPIIQYFICKYWVFRPREKHE